MFTHPIWLSLRTNTPAKKDTNNWHILNCNMLPATHTEEGEQQHEEEMPPWRSITWKNEAVITIRKKIDGHGKLPEKKGKGDVYLFNEPRGSFSFSFLHCKLFSLLSFINMVGTQTMTFYFLTVLIIIRLFVYISRAPDVIFFCSGQTDGQLYMCFTSGECVKRRFLAFCARWLMSDISGKCVFMQKAKKSFSVHIKPTLGGDFMSRRS